MRNVVYGILCGVLAFLILLWARPGKTVTAETLSQPPEGRFELVQLHDSAASEWSGILDTETGCVWAYVSQTPPTDAEVAAAPAGEKRDEARYNAILGNNFLSFVPYETGNSPTLLPEMEKESTTVGKAESDAVVSEANDCDKARLGALHTAAATP